MEISSLYALVSTAIVFIIDLVLRIALLIHVPKRRKPTAATAWLLFIFIIPIIGAPLFFLIGNSKLSRERRAKQAGITKMFRRYSEALEKRGLIGTPPQEHISTDNLITSLTGLQATKENTLTVLAGYDTIIDDIIEKIRAATTYVYVEFYILALDQTTEPFFEALKDAKARGVSVYVLFDAWGSRKFPRQKEMIRRLNENTTAWRKILPISFNPKKYNRPDLRNHRKIVVVDNSHAYTGSLNMIDKTYHRKDSISYIELAVHLQGPAVNTLAAVFASDWYSETDEPLTDFMHAELTPKKGTSTVQIIPSGPSYPYQNNLKAFVSLIYSAQQSVTITNPYLVPDESLLSALISAAKRGVHVSILNSEAMDQWLVGHAQRSYYAQLLEAGVQISLYKKPQLVHEKYMSIDDSVAVIGSSNLDIRSLELNLECSVLAYDSGIAKQLSARHESLLGNSRRVNLTLWKKRSSWQNFLDSIARLTSSLQ